MKTKMRNYLIAKVMKVKAAINNNKAEGSLIRPSKF